MFIFAVKLVGMDQQIFLWQLFSLLGVSRTECPIKRMMTTLYFHGNLLGSFYSCYVYGFCFVFRLARPSFVALTGLVLPTVYWPWTCSPLAVGLTNKHTMPDLSRSCWSLFTFLNYRVIGLQQIEKYFRINVCIHREP